jgi:hypothetical protein
MSQPTPDIAVYAPRYFLKTELGLYSYLKKWKPWKHII